MGRPLSDLYTYRWLSPEDEAHATQSLERQGFWRGENLHVLRSGRVLRVDSSVTVLTHTSGTPLGLLAVIRDVTEQKRIEETLREADRQKDEFLAILAHELRNPLAPIRTAVGILRAHGSQDRLPARARDVIDRQVAHMTRLIDDLLDVSRLSRGKVMLQRRALQLDHVLDAAIETALPVIEEHRHHFEQHRSALYNVIVTPQPNAPPSVVPWFVNFDGQYVAETHHSIVVTINYRYGLLGYLAHESLASEDPSGSTGNYGLLDQIKALNWVHDNIQHLGGDKGKVSLYGQSVGGMDICSLLTTPLTSTDLFQRAIITSEPGCNRPTKQWVERNVGDVVVANVGCAGASDIPACLRSLSASQIRNSFAIASPTWRIGSNVDGYALSEEPMAAIEGGRYLHMPIVQGGSADEYSALAGALFAVLGPVSSDDDYQRHIRHWFAVYGGTVADDVLAKYPSDTFGPPVVTFIRVMTDALETAVARRVARAFAKGQSEPVRRFLFTRGLANAPFTSFGAQHGIDLAFAFHNLNITAINGQVYTPTIRELGFADIVSGYWVRFIATGDPNGGGTTNWPLYNLSSETYLNFGSTISIGDGWRDADCDFWDATVPVPYVYTP